MLQLKASFAWLEVLLMRTRIQTYSALAIWYHPTCKTTAKIYPVPLAFVLSIYKSSNYTKSVLDLGRSVGTARFEFLWLTMSCLYQHEPDTESDTEVVLWTTCTYFNCFLDYCVKLIYCSLGVRKECEDLLNDGRTVTPTLNLLDISLGSFFKCSGKFYVPK